MHELEQLGHGQARRNTWPDAPVCPRLFAWQPPQVSSHLIVGPRAQSPVRPRFVVEVVRTSGGIDKLAVYQALEVPEVWFWDQGKLLFYRLSGGSYALAPRSAFLPGLDPVLIGRCMQIIDQNDAVRALRAILRAS